MTQSISLYVGTVGEGVWRSRDGGQSWLRASRGMYGECDVRALVVDPRDLRVLYAGTNEGLYRSADGGDHWRRLDAYPQALATWALHIASAEPDTIWAGARPAAVHRSRDGGAHWETLAAGVAAECERIRFNRITTLYPDPADRRTFWVGVEIDAVWRTNDGGGSWTRLGSGLSSDDIHGLAIVSETPGSRRILAATNNDLNLSTDEGATWVPQDIGRVFPWPYCRGLKQRTDRPGVLFLGNGDGPPGSVGAAWRSDDAGRSWRQLALPVTPNSTIWDFALHPANPSLVAAYSVLGEVFLTADCGETWEKLPREFGEIRSLVWTPNTGA